MRIRMDQLEDGFANRQLRSTWRPRSRDRAGGQNRKACGAFIGPGANLKASHREPLRHQRRAQADQQGFGFRDVSVHDIFCISDHEWL